MTSSYQEDVISIVATDCYIISLIAGAKPFVTPLWYANLALQKPIH